METSKNVIWPRYHSSKSHYFLDCNACINLFLVGEVSHGLLLDPISICSVIFRAYLWNKVWSWDEVKNVSIIASLLYKSMCHAQFPAASFTTHYNLWKLNAMFGWRKKARVKGTRWGRYNKSCLGGLKN